MLAGSWRSGGFLPLTPQPELLGRFMDTCFWAGASPVAVMHLVLDSCESLA